MKQLVQLSGSERELQQCFADTGVVVCYQAVSGLIDLCKYLNSEVAVYSTTLSSEQLLKLMLARGEHMTSTVFWMCGEVDVDRVHAWLRMIDREASEKVAIQIHLDSEHVIHPYKFRRLKASVVSPNVLFISGSDD